MKKLKRTLPIVLFALVAALLTTRCDFPRRSGAILEDTDKLRVHFIDVGQGDSILVQFPDGEVALIDGGPGDHKEKLMDYLKAQGVKRIDYLIATHPHEDHIGGLPDVVEAFDIGQVYMPKVSSNTHVFERLLQGIKAKGLKITTAKAGLTVLGTSDIHFDMLAPGSSKYDETNEYSAVLKLTYKNRSFLFTGDAERVSENEMMDSGFDLSVDVLKVGHHGGRTSTSKKFIEAVNPEVAVISLGKDNDYGHPHKETLQRLKQAGVIIHRTDEEGTVEVITDGDKLVINNESGK